MEITHWANGRDPEEYGWVIDGTNYTAFDLDRAWDEYGVEGLKFIGLPEEVVKDLEENCSDGSDGCYYSPSAYMLESRYG